MTNKGEPLNESEYLSQEWQEAVVRSAIERALESVDTTAATFDLLGSTAPDLDEQRKSLDEWFTDERLSDIKTLANDTPTSGFELLTLPVLSRDQLRQLEILDKLQGARITGSFRDRFNELIKSQGQVSEPGKNFSHVLVSSRPNYYGRPASLKHRYQELSSGHQNIRPTSFLEFIGLSQRIAPGTAMGIDLTMSTAVQYYDFDKPDEELNQVNTLYTSLDSFGIPLMTTGLPSSHSFLRISII